MNLQRMSWAQRGELRKRLLSKWFKSTWPMKTRLNYMMDRIQRADNIERIRG